MKSVLEPSLVYAVIFVSALIITAAAVNLWLATTSLSFLGWWILGLQLPSGIVIVSYIHGLLDAWRKGFPADADEADFPMLYLTLACLLLPALFWIGFAVLGRVDIMTTSMAIAPPLCMVLFLSLGLMAVPDDEDGET